MERQESFDKGTRYSFPLTYRAIAPDLDLACGGTSTVRRRVPHRVRYMI